MSETPPRCDCAFEERVKESPLPKGWERHANWCALRQTAQPETSPRLATINNERCDGVYPVPHRRAEPFTVTYRCGLSKGHDGPHRAEPIDKLDVDRLQPIAETPAPTPEGTQKEAWALVQRLIWHGVALTMTDHGPCSICALQVAARPLVESLLASQAEEIATLKAERDERLATANEAITRMHSAEASALRYREALERTKQVIEDNWNTIHPDTVIELQAALMAPPLPAQDGETP